MTTFRVLGEKPMLYWVELEAKDSHEAYDLAEKLTTDKWNLIEEDNTIEPVEVYPNDEEEQDVPLIEDEEEEFVFDPINVIGADDEA
jgi:hypothetical protein